MSETTVNLPYPYSVFPSDELRRVLAHLPAPKSDVELAEINAYHAELWAGEPVPAPTYPVALTFPELKALLDADAYSVTYAEGRDYTDGEVRAALDWNVEKGYATPDTDRYRMTPAGLAALCE